MLYLLDKLGIALFTKLLYGSNFFVGCFQFLNLRELRAYTYILCRSPVCRLIGPDEVWTLLDALQEQVPAEVHQHLETITLSSTPLLVCCIAVNLLVTSVVSPSPLELRPTALLFFRPRHQYLKMTSMVSQVCVRVRTGNY